MNSNSSSNNNKFNNNISNRTNNVLPEKSLKVDKSLGSPFFKAKNINYVMDAIKCSRGKTPEKDSNIQQIKNSKKNLLISFELQAYKNLSKTYNFTIDKYNLLCINYLLSNRTCRLVSVFKEKMIIDYIDEFLKRKYSFKESKERVPKFYLYYKHYSIFFGQPFFTDFIFNEILQKNGEKKARIYYKNHYQNGESKDEDNENIGFAESGSEDEEEEKKNNNEFKKNKNTIFSSGIKDNIDNVTLMTTINSFENNTINLGLNNEKIEIFSENKMEKSNDTTIGELMDDINKGIEEANKAKKKKKKNFSFGENFFSLIKKNINNNAIIENIKNKKKLIELINNNNIKKNIKNNSIKKKLFYVGNQNINLNCGQIFSSNPQRYNYKKNSTSIKKENFNKINNTNYNINSNKAYKKRKLLSYTNEEVNKLIDPNNPNKYKSPRQVNNNKNINNNNNNNCLNTINANTIHGYKKLNNMQKITSPISINQKKALPNYNNINSNAMLMSLNNNTNNTRNNNNKIKICKTLKSLADKNKKSKNISKNIINKEFATISGDKRKKINKLSFKKFDFDNFTETQIFKEKEVNKKIKGRNIISPLNNKCIENYTMTNEYINNIPFSANKNKNEGKNSKFFNNKVLFNNLTYQTINNDQGMGHQRTKSNLVQGIVKKNVNNNPTFTKILNTEMNNAYIKPAIRIKKNDKLYGGRPILNDTNIDKNYDNKTTINNNSNNNKVFNYKKISQHKTKYLNNINNNTNLKNELKNSNDFFNNNNLKNTNFNKYILEVIKKTKHQHYNSLTNQINPGNTCNMKDNIISKNKKKISNINLNNSKGYNDKDVLQIALSLFVNENSSRNIYNNTNILEPSNTNNNINSYYKLNNNQILHNNQNNNKKNYNLNININNEININENNTINNSTYINHTHRVNNKNMLGCKNIKNYFGDPTKQKEKNKCIANLKQKKYNMDPTVNNNRNNNCQSTKNNTINDNLIFNINNKNIKTKTRNYDNKNIKEALNSINNNFMNTFVVNNNSVDNNKICGNNYIKNINNINNINNKNMNSNIIKSYHTKSVTSLSDLMFHNKRLISLYKNLSKSK